jgi:branched-subunit amino acid ABC-type transport system permease component
MTQFIELLIGGLAIGCIYSLIALGFTMIIRTTGVLHFAQGELVMLGAMFGVTAHHLLPLPFIVLLLVGMAFGGLAAVAIELGVYRTLRLRRIPLMNVVIATIGMSILLQNTGQLVWGSEPIAYPKLFATTAYALGPARIAPQLVWIIGMGILVMVLLQLFLAFTRTGRAMQAAAQRPETAQLMGINLTRITAYTYGIAGGLGGAAGVLLGSLFYASFNMGFLPAIKAFVAATLGGLGSIGGAMVGGILFGLIETFAAIWVSTSYKDAVGMIILILILLAWPEGLLGLIRRGK